ncbi:hypothetical protein Esi_0265_0042 [Ectocarpus siliculosus]|uniref:Uncharacterized protein n=1 Tax=Ectocarpus siliculosus TaxID=2880 RepID=D7FU49_ECTSI|nr:hypothetical protein Esi_0265_0042 [Ectocarpus siliculosus]|eukprot:CBJ31576.1 hypothetical protein Esi_0265_0042 [Ectocarpus siliculosus]
MALMRVTTLVFMLQGVIAWGVVTSSNDGTSAAEEDLSMHITTTSEFPWAVIIGTLTALILSALTGQDAVVDILAVMFVTVPFQAFVETVSFVLLVLMHARFCGPAERFLSTAAQFTVNTWRYVDKGNTVRYKAAYSDTIKAQDEQLSSLTLQCNDFQRSNTVTQGDFSHYMWCAERQIDGLTARKAQLETNLALLEADAQTCDRLHDQLQTDLMCTIRDDETTLGKKDAEICSLTKDNDILRQVNGDKDSEIERLKTQLALRVKDPEKVDGAQDIADRSTEPPSPSLHSRWGSVDGASIFRASNTSAAFKAPVGRKTPDSSAAVIAAAAAGTFVYSKASRRATVKSATKIVVASTVSDADRAAAEALIADAGLEAWGLTMRATTSAGN